MSKILDNLSLDEVIFNANSQTVVLKASATASASQTLIFPPVAPAVGQILKATDTAGTLEWAADGGGEVNTASNVGTGEGVFKQKTGSDLEFKTLTATSTKITLANNTNDIGIDIAEANVDHNSLNNLAVGDVHTQYALSAGRAGGQTLIGGTVASESLTLESTANATKGFVEVKDDFHTSAGLLRSVTTSAAASLTLDSTHDIVAFSGTGAVAVALPAASLGRGYTIVKTGATGTVTITPNGADTIDGAASLAMNTQFDRVTIVVVSAGRWYIV